MGGGPISEIGEEGTEPLWTELLRLEPGEGSRERDFRPASLRSGAPGRTAGIVRPDFWGATTGGCRGVEGLRWEGTEGPAWVSGFRARSPWGKRRGRPPGPTSVHPLSSPSERGGGGGGAGGAAVARRAAASWEASVPDWNRWGWGPAVPVILSPSSPPSGAVFRCSRFEGLPWP